MFHFTVDNKSRPTERRLIMYSIASSRQTFPCTICRSVGLSVQYIVENGGSDPDTVWHHRSDGSRDEAGSGVWGSVHGNGYFWGRIWGAPL